MPSLTISRKVYKAGVLTDADTAPVLRDPTAAFGMIRDDTSAVIVAAGTALTRISQGVYQIEVDNLVSGVSYTYWIETTAGGVTTRQEKHYTGATGSASGQYATLADLQAWQGDNAELLSDINNTGTLDTARVQSAFDATDAEINMQLSTRGFAVPVVDTGWLGQQLTQISIRLAIAWLWGARDSRDEQETTDATGAIIKARTWRKDAMMTLQHICLYGPGLTRTVAGAVGYPTVVE